MKISSRVRSWVRQYFAAIVDGDKARQDALFASLTARDLPIVVAAMDQGRDEEDRQLLYLIANLRADGIDYVRRRSPIPLDSESDQALIQVRDELRQIWGKQSTIPRDAVLGEWFGAGDKRTLADESRWMVLFQFGVIRPRFFRGDLAWAYCRHHASLAICEDPDCPVRYFVANRRSQRYCCANDECSRLCGPSSLQPLLEATAEKTKGELNMQKGQIVKISNRWYVRYRERRNVGGVVEQQRVSHCLGPVTTRGKHPPADIKDAAAEHMAGVRQSYCSC